jgi:hypothetical protein
MGIGLLFMSITSRLIFMINLMLIISNNLFLDLVDKILLYTNSQKNQIIFGLRYVLISFFYTKMCSFGDWYKNE